MCLATVQFSWLLIEFFTNTRRGQCWHCCQLCIPIYLLFSPLFDYYYVSKCEIRFKGTLKNYISSLYIALDHFTFLTHSHTFPHTFLMAQPKQSWQCWHSRVMGTLWKARSARFRCAPTFFFNICSMLPNFNTNPLTTMLTFSRKRIRTVWMGP